MQIQSPKRKLEFSFVLSQSGTPVHVMHVSGHADGSAGYYRPCKLVKSYGFGALAA
jgi:hypothetical protein